MGLSQLASYIGLRRKYAAAEALNSARNGAKSRGGMHRFLWFYRDAMDGHDSCRAKPHHLFSSLILFPRSLASVVSSLSLRGRWDGGGGSGGSFGGKCWSIRSLLA